MVLGINYDENIIENELRQFVARLAINYPVLRTNPELLKILGPVTVLPTTYLINPAGEIAAWVEGPVTAQEIEEYILDNPVIHRK